jgi:dihydrofolate reductase
LGNVIMQASMSLDGFIADPSDRVGPLFDWYENGDVAFAGGDPDRVFHVSAASADYLRLAWADIAAEVIGRRLFDLTDGWDGRPAVGDAVFVVTHRPPADWKHPTRCGSTSCPSCSAPGFATSASTPAHPCSWRTRTSSGGTG